MALALCQLPHVSPRSLVQLSGIVLLLLLVGHEGRHEASLLAQLVTMRLHALVHPFVRVGENRGCSLIMNFSLVLETVRLRLLVPYHEHLARPVAPKAISRLPLQLVTILHRSE